MRAAAASCALALGLVACGGKAESGRGEGIVRAVDPVANRVTLDHGEIPGMMEPMLMEFDVANAALLDGLEPGDTVRFQVVEDGGKYTLTEVVEVPKQ
jgi:Cu/Ag efflux protein CusF